jgi:hypothetical protein
VRRAIQRDTGPKEWKAIEGMAALQRSLLRLAGVRSLGLDPLPSSQLAALLAAATTHVLTPGQQISDLWQREPLFTARPPLSRRYMGVR